jgi:hypothetical protein
MSHALAAAELALPVSLDAIAHGGLTPEASRAYERAWRDAFVPVTRRARLAGRIFEHRLPASWAMSFLSLSVGARSLPRLVASLRTGTGGAASR